MDTIQSKSFEGNNECFCRPTFPTGKQKDEVKNLLQAFLNNCLPRIYLWQIIIFRSFWSLHMDKFFANENKKAACQNKKKSSLTEINFIF